MSRRLDRDLVEVGVGKAFLDTLHEPVERRPVRDVGGLRPAGSAGEDAANTSLAVKDDGARVARGRECARFVVRKDCPLHGRLVSAVLEVLAHKGHDAGSAASGHAGGTAILDNGEARFVVRVEHLRAAQLVFPDDALKWQEAVRRVFEGGVGRGVGVHLRGKVVHRNLCA
jgi:hypothetical protein